MAPDTPSESRSDGTGTGTDLLASIDLPFLQQITQNIQDGLFVLDREGRLIFLNAEGERLLGWSMQDLLGKNMHQCIHYQNPNGVQISPENCPVQQCIIQKEVYRVEEETFIHREGHILLVSFISTPIFQKDVVTHSVTTFQDLHQRRHAEREFKQARDIAMETSRLRTEFLANMSHEIRTPINGMVGMTDLLLQTPLNKEQSEMARATRESAQSLLTVVDEILDFSHLEEGKLDLQKVDFRPARLLGEVIEFYRFQAQQKGLTLRHAISDQVPPLLKGDPARLRQALLNLTSNAIKFTPKGEIFLSACLEKKTNARVIVRFSVTDTGIGIPESAHHRIFQPFTQVDGSRSRRFGGAGLGLSITSRLVELMGGEIGFDSRQEEGSVFWFTVPLTLHSQPDRILSQQKTILTDLLEGIKALVVDPHQISQMVTLNHLLEWKMRGTAVESHEEALAYLRHEARSDQPCDLVLVSAHGLERSFWLARTFTQEYPLLPTKLVLLTGTRDNTLFEEARNAGFVAHMNRPISGPMLQECLLNLFHPDLEQTIPEPTLGNVDHEIRKPDQESNIGQPILLVEDNTIIQKMVQMQINRLGHQVRVVSNGQEATQAARESCSLILMDCKMPLMDGFQAAQAIRRQEKSIGSRRIPIIAMTATTQQGEKTQIREADMDDVLTKPVQIEHLADILEKWLPKQTENKRTRRVHDQQMPIKLDGIGHHFGEDPAIIQEFLQVYQTSTQSLLTKMVRAVEIEDAHLLLEYNRELRHASANIGAPFMSGLCDRLERVEGRSKWQQNQQIIKDMLGELDRIAAFAVHSHPG